MCQQSDCCGGGRGRMLYSMAVSSHVDVPCLISGAGRNKTDSCHSLPRQINFSAVINRVVMDIP